MSTILYQLTIRSRIYPLLLLFSFTVAFLTACAQREIPSSEWKQKLDAFVTEAYQKNIFSGVAMIADKDKLIFKRQEGYANWSSKTRFTDTTLFHIGSITKLYTDEMIYQLEKEGKINIHSPLSNYLNLFPAAIGDKIKITHLLEHSSGLGDYTQHPDAPKVEAGSFAMEDLLNLIKAEQLQFEPGTKTKYSNSGYVVLGALIEKITGKSYAQNLKERISDPLGIGHWVLYEREDKLKRSDVTRGALINFDLSKHTVDKISDGSPAGGIYTTPAALFTFAEAFRNGKLPSGRKVQGPAGFAGGNELHNAVIAFMPGDVMIIVMTNVKDIADGIGERLGDVARGKKPQPFEEPGSYRLYKIFQNKGKEYVKSNLKDITSKMFDLPYDYRFLNYFGTQFLNAGATDLAIDTYKINTELFSSVSNVWYNLGFAYRKKGDKANTEKYCLKALEVDPGNQHAKSMLDKLKTL